MLRSNVLGLLHLLEAAREFDYLGFVNAGSSLEYGQHRRPHAEAEAPAPSLFFGASKVAATVLGLQYARSTGRHLITLRIFSVFGPWESSHRLIPAAILAALRGTALQLTAAGVRHDPIFVDDVLDACFRAAVARSPSGRVLNIGSGIEWTNQQIVELIEEISGRRIPRRAGVFPPRAADTAHWRADIRAAGSALGWQPRHSLKEGLRKTIHWFRHHQNLYAQVGAVASG
jgi:nucleoside-diphosphate-sugar epimerase